MVQVCWTARDDVAVMTLDNPPVNGLGHALREGIVAGLQRALEDDAIRAIVITGAGRAFSGGADIREFNTPAATAEPDLRQVIARVEDASKPVVAAIHGFAMGGGLELALGCHYRVARADARIALPEVKLGLLPGAGGTQRLPRLVPIERATTMITTGTPVAAAQLQATPLFAAIVDDDVVTAAIDIAHKALLEHGLDHGRTHPRARDMAVTITSGSTALEDARARIHARQPHEPAPAACIEALTAAVEQSFDAGLERERELFLELVASPESRALRHAFFGERAASHLADVPADTPRRDIASAAIIGAGTMGGGIAMNFVNAGIPVTLVETKQAALQRGLATIRKNYERTAAKGRISTATVETRLALIQPTLDLADAAGADIVIEAVFEDLAVKKQVFTRLDAIMKPGAILASNTSTLDVNRIAAFTKRPQDVIGTHFFSPANVMRLLEVVRGTQTSTQVLATVMALARRIGKLGVVSGVCDGFIGNRMLGQYIKQAGYLVEEGASPEQVDGAIEGFGFKMGPFRMGDLAGNDVSWLIRKRRYAENPDMKFPTIADRICEQSRFGQKTGAGFYRYAPGRRDALSDPLVAEIITAHRHALGVTPRTIDTAEIIDRLVLALVNEGAAILEEGIADKASDIDMVYLNGYGFPSFRGGPMFYADSIGLARVAARMGEFARNPHGDPTFWTPAPLLAQRATAGGAFNN